MIDSATTGAHEEYWVQPNDQLIRPYELCLRAISSANHSSGVVFTCFGPVSGYIVHVVFMFFSHSHFICLSSLLSLSVSLSSHSTSLVLLTHYPSFSFSLFPHLPFPPSLSLSLSLSHSVSPATRQTSSFPGSVLTVRQPRKTHSPHTTAAATRDPVRTITVDKLHIIMCTVLQCNMDELP